MVKIKGNRLKNERKEARKVSNDDLPQNRFNPDLKGKIRGDFDGSIELSYLQWDLRYYADPFGDWIYP